MKNLFLVIGLLFSINLIGQTDSLVCKCAPIVKETVVWIESSRGNKYCEVVSKSGSIYKKYKKNFGIKPPKSPSVGKEWVQKSKGASIGEWYQRKIKLNSK